MIFRINVILVALVLTEWEKTRETRGFGEFKRNSTQVGSFDYGSSCEQQSTHRLSRHAEEGPWPYTGKVVLLSMIIIIILSRLEQRRRRQPSNWVLIAPGDRHLSNHKTSGNPASIKESTLFLVRAENPRFVCCWWSELSIFKPWYFINVWYVLIKRCHYLNYIHLYVRNVPSKCHYRVLHFIFFKFVNKILEWSYNTRPGPFSFLITKWLGKGNVGDDWQ